MKRRSAVSPEVEVEAGPASTIEGELDSLDEDGNEKGEFAKQEVELDPTATVVTLESGRR